jgi:hypothetical protein
MPLKAKERLDNMKQTISLRQFEQAFESAGRSSQFPSGLQALFEHLESYESDTGEEIELDVIGLCCDYTEDTIENVLKEYDMESIEELRDNTTVIEVDDETIIYQSF